MLSIKCEAIAGVDVIQIAFDMVEAANRTGMMIEVNVNGYELLAPPGTNPHALWNEYQEWLRTGKRRIP